MPQVRARDRAMGLRRVAGVAATAARWAVGLFVLAAAAVAAVAALAVAVAVVAAAMRSGGGGNRGRRGGGPSLSGGLRSLHDLVRTWNLFTSLYSRRRGSSEDVVAATPLPRRGQSMEMGRGDAAANDVDNSVKDE